MRLAVSCKELAKHGPLRPEETRGIGDEIGKVSDLDPNAYGQPTSPDEHGYRTGCPPPPEVAEVLRRTAEEAQAAVSINLVAQRRTLTRQDALAHVENMRWRTTTRSRRRRRNSVRMKTT